MFFSSKRDSKSFLAKLPSSGWFIAGGHVLTPDLGDIDIFFETEADYKHALTVAKRFFRGDPYTTANATTLEASDKSVQLIHHSFYLSWTPSLDSTLTNLAKQSYLMAL
jgi:hypothetical protein